MLKLNFKKFFFIFSISVVCSLHLIYQISREQRFLVWDNYAYYDYPVRLLEAFQIGLKPGLDFFRASLNTDYNLFFAIPTAILMSLLGKSRDLFLIFNYLVYGLTFQFVFASYAEWLTKEKWSWYLAFIIPILIPSFTDSFMIGLPDLGGSTIILLALWTYSSCKLNNENKTCLLIGVLIGFSFIFRRHFAYAGIALLMGIFIYELFYLIKLKLFRLRSIINTIYFIIKTSIISLVVCLLVIRSYTIHAITFNPSQAYLGYKHSLAETFDSYYHFAGPILCFIATIGFIKTFLNKSTEFSSILLFLITFTIWCFIWFFHVQFISLNYSLQFIVLFLSYGIFLFCYKKTTS
jgi:hypothetical protein